MAAQTPTQTIEPTPEELRDELWRRGELRWLLHGEQLRLYDKYRAWQKTMRADKRGRWRRIFVVGWSRRVGKDWWCCIVKLEDCLRAAGTRHTYATAYAKDLAEIVIPLMDEILETCPGDVRPKFHAASQGEASGYFFTNGSRLKCAGLDMHPNAIRGRACDGGVITEAAFVTKLRHAAISVLYPQFQGRPTATLILQSTAPEVSAGNQFDEAFIPDAKLRDAYDERCIDDNPMLSDEERDEFIEAAGGRGDPLCEREYYNARVRDPSQAVIPEYDDTVGGRHVKPVATPEYAHCYVGIDPGMQDMLAFVGAYWDWYRAKLCFQFDFAERNASTRKVVTMLQDFELHHWGQVTRFDTDGLVTGVYKRVSDIDARFIGDMNADYGLTVQGVDRTDDSEARLSSFRDAFIRDKIEIDPSCVTLRAHLVAATWNDKRTDYTRSEAFGHFDCLDAAEIVWRSVVRHLDPRPPAHYLDRSIIMHKREHLRSGGTVGALGRALGGKPSWQTR